MVWGQQEMLWGLCLCLCHLWCDADWVAGRQNLLAGCGRLSARGQWRASFKRSSWS